MAVINRKERFATEGIRFQRHNPDGTIPTAQRFLGFANTVNLSSVLNDGKAELKIKIDSEPAEVKTVSFAGATNLNRVTVQEAVNALNAADFTGIRFSVDQKTGRVKGAFNSGSFAKIDIQLENVSDDSVIIGANTYLLMADDVPFNCIVPSAITIPEGETVELTFISTKIGNIEELPEIGDPLDIAVIFAGLTTSELTGEILQVTDGAPPQFKAEKVQVIGKLAAALDFGQGIKQGGNGLEIISFFDDETVSIGIPKTVKDKEEIDSEGAKGTITKMIIGAMVQGLSPVVTLRQKDYYFVELVQGGKLDREKGTYNPPTSQENDQPTFYAEMFSALYSAGSNKLSDVSGYEKILFRSMTGVEGDVPAEAKSWALYAYNLTATEYTDELDKLYSAWQEQSMTLEEFDALKVKDVSIKEEA